METPTKLMYETALARIEELLPLVTDETPKTDYRAIELKIMSDIVIAYENVYYPIGIPTLSEALKICMHEQGLTQTAMAYKLEVSQTRISEYLSGKSEPTLKIARRMCHNLHIPPAVVMGV